MSDEGQSSEAPPIAQETVFKFDEEQIVRLKYNKSIHVFITYRIFDTKYARNFYFGRIFKSENIEPMFTKFAESELESILSAEQESGIEKNYPETTTL